MNNLPVNARRRDAAALSDDVNRAIALARMYLDWIRRGTSQIAGLRLLEIGPGINFGPELILASYGVQVTVADLYLASWDDFYHPQFYRQLRTSWDGEGSALDLVLAANGYPPGVLSLLPEPAEKLRSVSNHEFDRVISHAVLEHVFDLPAVCKELARVTQSEGRNIHLIDFKHHLDPSRPLEFLLEDEHFFRVNFKRNHGEQGNRWRPNEVEALFVRSGFEIASRRDVDLVSAGYLTEFLPRLRNSSSRYRWWDEGDLRAAVVVFEMRRGVRLVARVRAALRSLIYEAKKLVATAPGFWLRCIWKFVRPRYSGNVAAPVAAEGYCWRVRIPRWVPSDKDDISTLMIYEDAHPLGPAHAQHFDIREYGRGRFSHWDGVLYFSTTDNSDPRSNGRRYTIDEENREGV